MSSTTSPLTATVFGATGLSGSNILTSLLQDRDWTAVRTIARRAPKPTGATLDAVVEPDSTKWASLIAAAGEPPKAVISALGTTRAAAGGIAEQWKIDHDLNIELAKAAKEAGVPVFTFVSSAGTRGALSSAAPYSKMKNGVEDAVKDLGFDTAVIVKPGAILGERETTRLAEGLFQKGIRSLGFIRPGWRDALGQEAEVIGRAAANATKLALEGKAPSKYWVVEAADIIKLGKKEE